MDERGLTRLSIACGIIGLVSIYSLEVFTENTTSVGSIGIDDLGSTFTFCGNLSMTRVKNAHVFTNIADETGSIRLVIFNSSAASVIANGFDPYSLPTSICVEAKVEEYPEGSETLELIYSGGRIHT